MTVNFIKLFILLFAINNNAKAQSLTESEIVGTWKVLNVGSVKDAPKEEKEAIVQLTSAFKNAKFKFAKDKHFTFDFEMEDMEIKNGVWKLDSRSNSFIITDQKDKTAILMEIETGKIGNKILFRLSESSIVLEVQKE